MPTPQRTIDIRKLAQEFGGSGVQIEDRFDFSRRDFDGFTMPQPVAVAFAARGAGGIVKLAFTLEGSIEGECVRCLEPYTQPFRLDKTLDIDPAELVGAFPEYPTAGDGVLDLCEFAYGEVVLEAPIVPLCREDCPGLCPCCGQPKAACQCPGQAGPEEEAPPPDPRWDALRALLDENK